MRRRVVIRSMGPAAVMVAVALAMPVAGQSPSPGGSASPVPTDPPRIPATVDLPAGTQFRGASETLPRAIIGSTALATGVVEHDGRLVGLGEATAGRGVGGTRTVRTVSLVRTPDGSWSVHPVDDLRGFRRPAGRPTVEAGVHPVAIAAGPKGIVAIGSARFRTSSFDSSASAALIWHSPDGRTWRRIDPRSVLGSGSNRLDDVIALPDGGYLATGSVGSLAGRQATDAVVLGSDDGRTWRRLARLDGTWSLDPSGLYQVGDQLVLAALEYICSSTNSHQTTFSLSGQLRLWRSRDGGRGWEPIDLSSVPAVTPPAEEAPRRSGQCPRSIVNQYASSVAAMGSSGGQLTLLSQDGATVSSTRDLETWHTAQLPGADSPDVDVAARRILDTAMTTDNEGAPVLLSLEAWRRSEDRPSDEASQVQAWRTTDDGVTWMRWPSPAPFIPDAVIGLAVVSPDLVLLVDRPIRDSAPARPARVTAGTPGPLVEWAACRPAAGADCRFATLEDVALPRADLTAIDLSYATLPNADLTGAILRDARLDGVQMGFDALLTGADLTGASLRGATLWGDLTGATFDGADLRGARGGIPLEALPAVADARDVEWIVPAELPDDLDLSGRNLGAAQFRAASTSDELGDLRDADFRGTDLDGSYFSRVDLTGSNLRAARWQTLTFLNDVICPDGKPGDEDVFGPERCRLKPR